MIFFVTVVACAWLIDRFLGEPPVKWHPLVYFGKLSETTEVWLRKRFVKLNGTLQGFFAVLILVLPLTLCCIWLMAVLPGLLYWLISVIALWLALGMQSLVEHATRVQRALENEDLTLAQQELAQMVGRDTNVLNHNEVASATVESVLENGCDAIAATLFWFMIGGLAGVVAWRLINTLDAMWGYRNERYQQFGTTAARLDDLMGWLPARLTALGYLLAGHFGNGYSCWRQQGKLAASPNAGPVVAAGAGAMGVTLHGPLFYQGQKVARPERGTGQLANMGHIQMALVLVKDANKWWIGILALTTWFASMVI